MLNRMRLSLCTVERLPRTACEVANQAQSICGAAKVAVGKTFPHGYRATTGKGNIKLTPSKLTISSRAHTHTPHGWEMIRKKNGRNRERG